MHVAAAVLASLLTCVLASAPARAELNLPSLAGRAEAYRTSLAQRTAAGMTDALALAEIANADAGRAPDRVIAALEHLIPRSPTSFDLWHRLAVITAEHRELAPNAMAVAYTAYTLAADKLARSETLLILGRVVRARMKHADDERRRVEIELRGQSAGKAAPDEDGDNQTSSNAGSGDDSAKSDEDVDISFPSSAGRRPAATPQKARETAVNLTRLRGEIGAIRREQAELFAIAHRVYLELFQLHDRPLDRRHAPWEEILAAKGRVRLANQTIVWRGERERLAACVKLTVVPTGKAETYKGRWIELRSHVAEGEPGDPGEPVDAEVTIEHGMICLGGVRHGGTYSVLLKHGMPISGDITLAEEIGLERRKAPNLPATIRFQNSAYVVPAAGARLVPIRTVNVPRLSLELVRISDRALYRRLALKQIGKEMTATEIKDLYRSFSDPIWHGELNQHATPSNQLVTANLPIFKLLEARQRWLRDATLRTGAEALRLANADDYFTGGEFYSDPVTQQGEMTSGREPGVYALVAKPASAAGGGESDATSGGENKTIYSDTRFPVQWFVFTDIGLTYLKSEDKLYVVARSLASGEAIVGARVQLVARNNRVLAEQPTNARGVAVFAGGLARGEHGNALAAVLAHHRSDFSFVDLVNDRLDLSRLDVGGRLAPGRIDAFVHTDRGVYRPGRPAGGEARAGVVRALVLLRDGNGEPLKLTAPVRVRLRSVLGTPVGDEQTIAADVFARQSGGHLVELEVPDTAPFGAARVEVLIGSDTRPVGSADIEIAHLRPDRARILFDAASQWSTTMAPDGLLTFAGGATAQYLQARVGPDGKAHDVPANNLSGDLEVLAEPDPAPFGGCHKGFSFGATEQAFQPYLIRQPIERTGMDGRVRLSIPATRIPPAGQPLSARVTLSLQDEAGQVASRTTRVPVHTAAPWIGLRRGGVSELGGGRFAVSLEAIVADGQGSPTAGETVTWRLLREREEFLWYEDNENWKYVPDVRRVPVAGGAGDQASVKVERSACGAANVVLPPADLEAGYYVLEASTASGARSSLRFAVGATTQTGASRPEPQLLRVFAGNETAAFVPGRPAEFVIEAPFDGKVLAAVVMGGEVVGWYEADTQDRRARLAIPVPEVWGGRTAHLLASVHRRDTDGSTARGPGRAIGALAFSVDLERRRLTVGLDGTPYRMTPAANLKVRVTARDEKDAPFTGKAMLALMAVDEGLLTLTEHQPPDPFTHFHGRRRLAFDIRDTYSRLLLTSARDTTPGGDTGRVFARLIHSNYLADRIVAAHVLREVEFRDGVAEIDDPALHFERFNGTVRLMATVWTANRVGGAVHDVLVRDLMLARLGVPRFLSPGDKLELPFTIENVDALDDTYAVRIEPGPVLRVLMPGETTWRRLDDMGDAFTLELKRGDRRIVHFAVEVDEKLDRESVMTIAVTLESRRADNPVRLSWQWKPKVRLPYAPSLHLVAAANVAPGRSQALKPDAARLGAIHQPRLQARVTAQGVPLPPVQSPAALGELPQTAERLAWSAMLLNGRDDAASRTMLTTAVRNLLALQHTTGAFLPFKPEKAATVGRHERQSPDDALNKAVDGLTTSALVLDVLRETDIPGIDKRAALVRGARFLASQVRARLGRRTGSSQPGGRRAEEVARIRGESSMDSDSERPIDGGPPGDLGAMIANAPLPPPQGQTTSPGSVVVLQAPTPDSGAANAGLVAGDVLVKLDGFPVTSSSLACGTIKQRSAGSRVVVRIRRGQEERDVTVVLGRALPGEANAGGCDAGDGNVGDTGTSDGGEGRASGRDNARGDGRDGERRGCTLDLAYAADVLIRLRELTLKDLDALATLCATAAVAGGSDNEGEREGAGGGEVEPPGNVAQLIAAAALKAFGKPELASPLVAAALDRLKSDGETALDADAIAIMLVYLNRLEADAGVMAQLASRLPATFALSTEAWLTRFGAEARGLTRPDVTIEPQSLKGAPLIEVSDARGQSSRVLAVDELPAGLTVRNNGRTTVRAALFARGIARARPAAAPSPSAAGANSEGGEDDDGAASIIRSFSRLDGTPIPAGDLALAQNESVAVVIEGKSRAGDGVRRPLLLVDLMPSTFEIVAAVPPDPDGADASKADDEGPPGTRRRKPARRAANLLFDPKGDVLYDESRDDKYVAVVMPRDDGEFRIVYIVRATVPGEFRFPPAQVEDLNRPLSRISEPVERKVRVSRRD